MESDERRTDELPPYVELPPEGSSTPPRWLTVLGPAPHAFWYTASIYVLRALTVAIGGVIGTMLSGRSFSAYPLFLPIAGAGVVGAMAATWWQVHFARRTLEPVLLVGLSKRPSAKEMLAYMGRQAVGTRNLTFFALALLLPWVWPPVAITFLGCAVSLACVLPWWDRRLRRHQHMVWWSRPMTSPTRRGALVRSDHAQRREHDGVPYLIGWSGPNEPDVSKDPSFDIVVAFTREDFNRVVALVDERYDGTDTDLAILACLALLHLDRIDEAMGYARRAVEDGFGDENALAASRFKRLRSHPDYQTVRDRAAVNAAAAGTSSPRSMFGRRWL